MTPPPPARRFEVVRSRLFAATAIAVLVFAPALPNAAQAVDGDTGAVTSVPFTIGKGQGSGRWGVIGDVRTLEPGMRATFTYGVGVNPVNGALLVTDSGKTFIRKPYIALQLGTPSISNYSLIPATSLAQTGYDDREYTEYSGAGQYAVDGTPDSNRTRNTGVAKRYADFQDRFTINMRDDIIDIQAGSADGPRGIGFTSDGTAWVVNHDKKTLPGDTPNKLLRFRPDMTEVTPQLLRSGSLNNSEHSWGSYSAGVTSKDEVLVDSLSGGSVIRFDKNGNQLPSFRFYPQPADLYGPFPYDAKALWRYDHVSVDKSDDSFYLSSSRFRHHPTVDPYLEKRDKNNNVIAQFTSANLKTQEAIRGSAVDQPTGEVFAWNDKGQVIWWNRDGAEQGTLVDGQNPGEFPGLTATRGIDFDANGRMYLTVAEGTGNTRVMLLGQTPAPVTALTATRSVNKTTVNFEITTPSLTANGQAPYRETQVLDFVIEETHDGGATWQVVAKDAGVSYATSQTVSGLDPNLDYSFRVSAWNEAGNGDWREVHPAQAAPPAPPTPTPPTPHPTPTPVPGKNPQVLTGTGATLQLPLLAAGAIAVVAGCGALLWRKRKTTQRTPRK